MIVYLYNVERQGKILLVNDIFYSTLTVIRNIMYFSKESKLKKEKINGTLAGD